MGPMARLGCIAALVIVIAMVALVLFILTTSIREYTVPGSQKIRRLGDVPLDAWARLRDKTIFFGHHSVGGNIVQGLQELAAGRESLKLNIVKTKDPKSIQGPVLAHASVGQNLQPLSKIAEFQTLMHNGLAEEVDIAFFKLCFVDMGKTSDPNAILAAYSAAMDTLKSRFPKVVFVHLTVPLCGPPQKAIGILKASARRLLGRPPVLEENQVRARFNSLLRERYSGKEPLFDLALYETLGSDGLRHYGLRNGQEVPVLARSYTDDGGHLNLMGRQHVAEQLLIYLADLACGAQ